MAYNEPYLAMRMPPEGKRKSNAMLDRIKKKHKITTYGSVFLCFFFTLINTLTRKTQKTWKDSTKRHNEKGEYLDKINTKRNKTQTSFKKLE